LIDAEIGIKYCNKSSRKLKGTALFNSSGFIAGNNPKFGNAKGTIGMKPATSGKAKAPIGRAAAKGIAARGT
jgi:hypothetical protein